MSFILIFKLLISFKFILLKIYLTVTEFHESKNIFVSSIKEIIKMLEENGNITNIQYEEKFTPVGNWCGQVGEIVSFLKLYTVCILNQY